MPPPSSSQSRCVISHASPLLPWPSTAFPTAFHDLLSPSVLPSMRHPSTSYHGRPRPSLTFCAPLDATSFHLRVQPEPTRVDLTLERRSSEVTLLFRAKPPPRSAPSATSSLLNDGQWANALELPANLMYEVWHKSTGTRVLAGATSRADVAPRVAVRPGVLFVGETYTLKALPGADNISPYLLVAHRISPYLSDLSVYLPLPRPSRPTSHSAVSPPALQRTAYMAAGASLSSARARVRRCHSRSLVVLAPST